MKKIGKAAVLAVFFITLLVISCSSENENLSNDAPAESKADYGGTKTFASRTDALNYIFGDGTDGVAEITISITRTEWNHMLTYYDWDAHNETCVHVDFSFTKGGNTWRYDDIGFRIRGHSSRARPQEGWGAGNNDYQQAHFKIDFEEFLEDGAKERLMANYVKSLMLKRFKEDPTYVREVYAYNMFRANGIWTAPRAGYAHLTVNISESDGTTEEVDFGAYALIEPITKQFLKERTEKQGGGTFSSNDGNLWKCAWPAAMTEDYDSDFFGCEEVKFTGVVFDDENIGTEIDSSTYEAFIRKNYTYDLKTNKKSLETATTQFQSFISELNALPDSESGAVAIKSWFESKMDVDLFIKTYAVNVLLGMWDDYWVNNNNYYFYFDENGKAYFIPYDYDNILGVNLNGIDWANRNPLEWGLSENEGKRPLIEKLLLVPEYKALYKKYVLEFSKSGSYFSAEKSKERITKMHNVIRSSVYSPNLNWATATFPTIYDKTEASWSNPWIDYKLWDGTPNYFETRASCIEYYCGNSQ